MLTVIAHTLFFVASNDTTTRSLIYGLVANDDLPFVLFIYSVRTTTGTYSNILIFS